jgi:hypothetical protein
VDTIALSDGIRKVCCPDGYEASAKVDPWHAEEMRNRQYDESMRPDRDDGTVAQAQHLG